MSALADIDGHQAAHVARALKMEEDRREVILGQLWGLRRSRPLPGRTLLHRWVVENLLHRKRDELDEADRRIRLFRGRLMNPLRQPGT